MTQHSPLKRHALAIRAGILRAIAAAGSGHPGGSLSAVEILTTLYFDTMKLHSQDPNWSERDRFVLCKGHAAPALYATLVQKGYFAAEELVTLRQLGSRLQGHPEMKNTPGVDFSTGSLGQGLSAALGMSLASRQQFPEMRVFALLGDGELQEGQVWEALMAAGHYQTGNLTAIIDQNGLQIDGDITEVMSPLPIAEKLHAFNWEVHQVDGHSFAQLQEVLNNKGVPYGKPKMIIAETVKGKGISFMEADPSWHGRAPDPEQLAEALLELEMQLLKIGGASSV